MVATMRQQPVPLSVLRAFDVVGGARLSRALAALLLLAARDAIAKGFDRFERAMPTGRCRFIRPAVASCRPMRRASPRS
jgi:hypothetical protein